MSVSIKVSLRCRPFVVDDALGVNMITVDSENGEVELLNTKYSTTRFAFSYSWWSAYGWERHLTGVDGKGDPSPDDLAAAENMQLVNQEMAYSSVGVKIMNDLLEGNACVLFAYGLSGSGKTFTVFGPDAPDIPEAWFKHKTPHDLWGIFPRLAYELFQKKVDGWKISMKYFQNVVDTVRDLMSPVAKEMNYKSGMKKDKDGFMDVDWCISQVLETWDDLRTAFTNANARKAIAPTQFNHQSTRGHCIMVLEVEMPHPSIKGVKQRGRIYVCDLAGTEPAGDIYYADYKKVVYENGQIEHKLLGPDADQSKTKQLQDQGKKINLSLSEMAQFFMKMANAVKSKKLKAGQTIPGCNTYFLCKFLKDTMLQAKTYLFCAIRPEVQFQKYTFATLGFAKNASVIKLAPKKATSNQSKKEMQLLEELEKMKKQMEEMQKSAGGVDMGKMNEMLAEKQAQLAQEMKGEVEKAKQEEVEKQKQQYQKRGILMSVFETDPQFPYLINLDEESFRDRRFIYMFSKETTVFGKQEGDIRPMSMHMVNNHCSFERKEMEVTVVGGNGEVYHNGKMVEAGQKCPLKLYDRLVIGQEILMYLTPGVDQHEGDGMPSVREAIQEYYESRNQRDSAYQAQAKKLEEDKKKLEAELEKMKSQGKTEDEIEKKKLDMAVWKSIDEEMMQMIPTLKQMKDTCVLLGRDILDFKLSLQQPKDDKPSVKVQVTNTTTNTVAFLDPFEVRSNLDLLNDQIFALKNANVKDNEHYTVPAEMEIVKLLFDTSYQIGSCTNFLLHCTLLMATEEEDNTLDIMKSVIPYNKIGQIYVHWEPIKSAEDETTPDEVFDPSELIGKSWTYKIHIGKISHLPTKVTEAYVEYEFQGTKYYTDAVSLTDAAREVDLEYSFIHHVDVVDQEFLDYLDEVELKFNVFIKPWVEVNLPPISTENPKICKALGIEYENPAEKEMLSLKNENLALKKELDLLREEKYEEAWKTAIAQLEDKLAALEANAGSSKVAQKLQDAKDLDAKVQ